MDVLWPVIGILVALALLYFVVKLLKGCLVKIVIGLIIVAAAAFLVYFFLVR